MEIPIVIEDGRGKISRNEGEKPSRKDGGQEITFSIVIYEDGSWSDLTIHSDEKLRNKQISLHLSIEELDED